MHYNLGVAATTGTQLVTRFVSSFISNSESPGKKLQNHWTVEWLHASRSRHKNRFHCCSKISVQPTHATQRAVLDHSMTVSQWGPPTWRNAWHDQSMTLLEWPSMWSYMSQMVRTRDPSEAHMQSNLQYAIRVRLDCSVAIHVVLYSAQGFLLWGHNDRFVSTCGLQGYKRGQFTEVPWQFIKNAIEVTPCCWANHLHRVLKRFTGTKVPPGTPDAVNAQTGTEKKKKLLK
jgi:hypothetical protein